ncbi:hypothetical protein ACOZ4N_00230 (plasmid) [Halorientalis pallida]|uniref:hypothetical protein n=1 Tax=Halorientalis pallida TaxID=2479928 RepID=UPI003C6F5573
MHTGNHDSSAGGGGGGGGACASVAESDKHAKWKSLAADRLEHVFEDRAADCEMEYRLAAPQTEKQHRDGDAAVIFTSPDAQLGTGVIIEVQHKNESKDRRETVLDYDSQGFATVWATAEDFADDRCRLTEADIRKRAHEAVWPWTIPEQETWPAYECSVDRTRANVATQMLVEREIEIPATLPPEWYDDLARWLWQWQDWETLFDPPEDHTDIWPYAKVPATLPPKWHDEQARQLWRGTDWSKLVRGTDGDRHGGTGQTRAIDHIVSLRDNREVPIEIDIASFIDEAHWRLWWQTGTGTQRTKEVDIDLPPTPFDDVQCHECEHYIGAEQAGGRCSNCGTPYDWVWNVETGRVSKSAVPVEIDLLDIDPLQ